MKKIYLFEFYIYYFEKIFNNDTKNKINELWDKLKLNEEFLEYAINIINNKFKSNAISYKILKDNSLYNTKIYNNLINKIYENKIIAAKTPFNSCGETFLYLTLSNKKLKLNKNQKLFLIYEAENSPFSQKYYETNSTHEVGKHGFGIHDIRFKILLNPSFTTQEKKNLFLMFYPDTELKIAIIEELEWELEKELNISTSELYNLKSKDIKDKFISTKKITEILKKISLYKYYRSLVPKEMIKKYINND